MPKKRVIEELLEAFAKERKAAVGSDLKMPNPMRTRLQEEVARQYHESSSPSPARDSWWTGWWPRLALAAAALLMVAIPVWVQFRTEPQAPGQLASNRSASRALNPALGVPSDRLLASNEDQRAGAPVPGAAPAPVMAPTESKDSSIGSDIPTTVTAGQLAANAPSAAPNASSAVSSDESITLAPIVIRAPKLELAKTEPAAPIGGATNDGKLAANFAGQIAPSAHPAENASAHQEFASLDKKLRNLDQHMVAQAAPKTADAELKPIPAKAPGSAPAPSISQRYFNAAPPAQVTAGARGGTLAFSKEANTQANAQANSSRNTLSNQLELYQARRRTASNILNSFDFEQTGNRVKVTDADGSTYTGEIQPEFGQTFSWGQNSTQTNNFAFRNGFSGRSNSLANSSPTNANSISNSNALAAIANPEQTQNLRFRATGSNLTVKKPLVFEATCIMSTGEPQREPLQKLQQQSPLNSQLQATPARIVGVARIAGEPEIEVDASPSLEQK